MKLLWRYIFKELTGPFIFGLAVITFVLLMDYILDVLDKIINKGLSAPVVLEIFVLSLAWMLALSIPMAVLIAAIMGFGRMSSDSEVIAFKSCGVSLINIMVPGIIMGLILMSFMIWFNDKVLPEANHRARMLMADITRKKPTWSLEPNVFLDYFTGYHILVRGVDNDKSTISDVTILDHRNAKAPRTITAKSGQIEFSDDGSLLIMHLNDGEIHEPDPEDPKRYRRTSFKKQTMVVEGASTELVRSNTRTRGDREMSVSMMIAENEKYHEKIEESRVRIDSVINRETELYLYMYDKYKSEGDYRGSPYSFKKAAKWANDLISHIDYQRKNIATYERHINSRNVEIHKKFSIPAACVVFMLLGAPLGVMTRKGGMATSIALSLIFFIIYWAFLIGGEELADRMYISGKLSMWLPNVVIGLAGIYLTSLINKRTTIEGMSFLRRIFPGSNN